MIVSKGIMDLHQGDLTVASEGEGFGCTFSVTIQTKDRCTVALSDASEFKSSDTTRTSTQHSKSSWSFGIGPISFSRSSFSSLKITPKDIVCEAGQAAELYLQRSGDECRSFSEEVVESTMDDLPPAAGSPLTTTTTTTLRILVVDDSTSNRKMLVRLLKDRCRDITEAVDGLDAVRKIRDAMDAAGSKGNTPSATSTSTATSPVSEPQTPPYDVVLMDFIMPNMEGPEAARSMREGGYCGLIIGITGNMLPVDKERYLREGANMVLTKPVNIQEIDKALQQVETNKRRQS